MENQVQEKRFLKKEFDKFKNHTVDIWENPISEKAFGDNKWKNYMWEMETGYGEDKTTSQFDLQLRHLKAPDLDALLIYYFYYSNEWMFLREGRLIINIDGVDNIELKPVEIESDVSGGGRVKERGFYTISKEQLKQICDAKEVAVRVSGKTSYFELKDKGLLKFYFMCRSFYAEIYDDNSYDEWINSIVPPGTEGKGGGCFIATATMSNYDHPVVVELRQFRDNWLLKRNWGKKFTHWYYQKGPKAAKVIEKSNLLRLVSFYFIVKPLQLLTRKLK